MLVFFLLRPNHFKPRTTKGNLTLGRQHHWEFNFTRAKNLKQPRSNGRLHHTLKPIFSWWKIFFWDYRRQKYALQGIIVPPQATTALPNAFLSGSTHFIPLSSVGPSISYWAYSSQSINPHLTSISCVAPSLFGNSFDASIDNNP